MWSGGAPTQVGSRTARWFPEKKKKKKKKRVAGIEPA